MAINSDELAKALQENLKLRRELATEMAGANGEKLAAVRYRSTRVLGALRNTFFARIRRASMSAAVVELMTLDGAREQYAAQLRQLDRAGLLREIETLRRLLRDLPPPREP
jgi:cell division protein FtsB